jgi:uncharacterized damage-inducible protein DinB
MNLTYFHEIFDYNYALHSRVWDSIMQITDSQFLEEIPYSIGSIRNHMVHLMNVDQRWLCRVMQMPLPAQRINQEEYLTRAATRLKWEEIEKFVCNSVYSLSESDLDRPVEIKISSRPNMNIKPVWQILAHVVNHGTDHRAQILPILYRMGAPTFDQDLMLHLWQEDE